MAKVRKLCKTKRIKTVRVRTHIRVKKNGRVILVKSHRRSRPC